MPSHRLIAIITALTCLAGARGAYAAYSPEQLAQMEELIISKDCGGLRDYIDRNPVFLEGDDPLAGELRNFASGVDSGLISCLAYRGSGAQGLAPATADPVDPADPADLGTVTY
jgi:hypothetical protein